ncbi:MAG TPA: hypothetical protein VGQ75_05830, partial [Thermoanaerobaculia bacterium]|nr:hypothetical protein [Thermoanaerobaculia bacterium]
MRSKEVRKALAIQEAGGQAETAAPSPHWRGALHAVAYFGVPVLAIVGGRERRPKSSSTPTPPYEPSRATLSSTTYSRADSRSRSGSTKRRPN